MQVRHALPSVFSVSWKLRPSVLGFSCEPSRGHRLSQCFRSLWLPSSARKISSPVGIRANRVQTELPCFCAFARERGNPFIFFFFSWVRREFKLGIFIDLYHKTAA